MEDESAYHDIIAKVAYRYWEEDGKPLFVEHITQSNWTEAVIEVMGGHHHHHRRPHDS